MNPNRPGSVVLAVLGTIFILAGLGAQPLGKLALVIGLGLIVAAIVHALRDLF